MHPRRALRVRRRRHNVIPVMIAVVLVLLVVGLLYLGYGPGSARPAYHWHVQLSITVRGQSVTIPGGIGEPGGTWRSHSLDGFGTAGFYPLHTQDSDGVVHIEPSQAVLFRLRDFFGVWGGSLSEDCISIPDMGQFCSGIREDEFLITTINTLDNFGGRPDHDLADGDRIHISF